VLAAAGDPRAADMVTRAGEYLRTKADHIRDDALRARFLATPVNTALARLAASAGPAS